MTLFVSEERLNVAVAGAAQFDLPEATFFRRGYIGNLSEVAANLGLVARAATPLDEARVLLAAKSRWGADFAQRLSGEFALICRDRDSGVVTLHHDEYGLTPLFYEVTGAGLRVAFHLEELAADLGEADLDGDYIRERLRFGDTYGARTPYRKINRLAPGQYGLWDGTRLTLKDCWSSAPSVRTPSTMQDNAAELRTLIESAVAAALPVSGRVWGELSGGLDSSTVVAMALRQGRPGFETVTYAYPVSPAADESDWVAKFREALPVPLHVIDGDRCAPFSAGSVPRFAEPTIGLVHARRDAALEELLRANDVDCLLTGMGGDQVLFGYRMKPYFFIDALRAGRPLKAFRELQRWSDAIYPRRSALRWVRQLSEPPMFAPTAQAPPPPWLTRETARSAEQNAKSARMVAPPGLPLAKRRYMESILNGARIVSTCHAARRSATQVRNPLYDRHLVEFCRDLPWEDQAGGAIQRPLLRKAMSGILPEPIRARTDKPNFDQVLFRGLRSPSATLGASSRESYLARGGFIDPDAWDDALEKARLGFAPDFRAFLITVTLELWLGSRFGAQ